MFSVEKRCLWITPDDPKFNTLRSFLVLNCLKKFEKPVKVTNLKVNNSHPPPYVYRIT